ncbi:molecular chaperone TorD family protein [Azospirillum sp. TSO22-1]|uniref:TorD/DmsD family molecular chaperone n=1 Tax=Azospirillum sp. TSO22-1 TaxID=716789 RepID=UPI000D611AD4|nr:molecular chaperone TorD family protein [Azospirillum sp. TSO22-1]PWC55283.1 molecular chaperone TorD [Azospirillum sp. TSO22-1]
MSSIGADASALPDEEILRAQAYGLLAGLLSRAPDADALTALAAIEGAAIEGDGSALGAAYAALGAAARAATPRGVAEEFDALFIGVGGGELTPFGSYYRTGFLHEKPLAELRGDMARLGIERAEGIAESEDHVAALCEMMAGLITGDFDAPADLDEQRAFFGRHIEPWAPRFFADLEGSPTARFYRAVGTLGRRFMDVEGQAFALAV